MQPRQIVSFRTHSFSRLLTKKRLLEIALVLLASVVIYYAVFKAVDAQIIGPGVAQVGSGSPKTNASSSKAGSILFFHKYASDIRQVGQTNTVVTLTNVNPNDGVTVRLIAMHDCISEEKFFNLAANQTRTLLMSKEFPDTFGSLIAIAVTPTGAPTQFNWLIGSATVRDWAGNEGSYNAFAVAKRTASTVPRNGNVFDLNFDGIQYDQLPQVIAADNLQSANAELTLYSPPPTLGDNSSTGNIVLGATLYDSKGKAFSSDITGFSCGLFGPASDFWSDQPVDKMIKAGQAGWAKFTSSDQTNPKKPKQLPVLGVSLSTMTGKPQSGAVAMQVLEWMDQFTISLKAQTPPIASAPETPTQDQTEPVGGATGASESKAGSILLYPRFISSKAGTTLINLTNTHPAQKARVRLFFSSVAPGLNVTEKIVIIEPSQAISLKASDVTDAQRGWVLAMAIDSGAKAIQFNHLIGSSFVTETSGVTTAFNAIAFGKNSDGAVPTDEDNIKTATLNFNDEVYDRLPASWGLPSLPNQDHHNSYLSYSRFTDSLLAPPTGRGSASVTVYDKTLASFVGLVGPTEIALKDLPKSLTRLPAAATAGNAGWLRMNMTSPSLAVVSNFATGAITPTEPDGWVGGLTGSSNLHILSTISNYALKVPAGNPNNRAPIAEFYALQFETETRSQAGTIVRLDGTPSNDPDPDDVLTYEWYVDGKMVSTAVVSDFRLNRGSHEIKLFVTDSSGEVSDPFLQTVEVGDRTPPVISRIPSEIVVTTTGNLGTATFPIPYAYDSIDGIVTVTSSRPSGSNFSLGLTTVVFTAQDKSGNKATATMDVVVQQGATNSQTGGVPNSTAPFLPNLNDQYVKPGEVRRILLQAEDVDGDPVSFRLSGFAPGIVLGNFDPVARQATLFIGPRAVNAPAVQLRIEVSDNKQQNYRTLPFLIANSEVPNDDTGSGGGGGGRTNRNPNAVIAPLPPNIEATEVDGIVMQLSALLSSDPDLDSLSYVWNVNGQNVANVAVADVKLGLGVNTINLTVTDGRGGTGRATATVQVLPRGLSVKSATPSRLTRNSTTTVTILGSAFTDRSAVFITGGGVFADSYFSRTEGTIVLSIRVASNASPGTRDILVINPDGKSATLRSGLVIQ